MTVGSSSHPLQPTPLRLKVLGDAQLVALFDSGPRTLLEVGKPLALITYVACAPGRTARREQLQDLIWADLDLDAGRHAIRQTLWYIRKKVPMPLLETQGDSISISVPLDSDRDQLLAAAAAGDLERVVEGYPGPFLPEFAAPGGAEFERWAEIERAHLRSLYTRSAEELIRRWLSSGRARVAQSLARRLRDVEPSNEAAWRLLLEAMMSDGDLLGASIEADALERLWQSESDELEPATRSVLRLIRKRTARPNGDSSDTGPAVPLVGRQAEFSTIVDAWDRCRTGTSCHIHVSAPPGLGKTRLISDVYARLRTLRARIVHIRAAFGQRDLPYSLVSELVASVAVLPGALGISPGSAATLVALNPTLSGAFKASPARAYGSESLRHRSLAVRELVDSVSQDSPLAILIDDLHWADAASIATLQGALTTLAGIHVMIVTTSRIVPHSRLSIESTKELRLRAISAENVAELLNGIADLPVSGWASDLPALLREVTGGSPLLVLETLRLLRDENALVHDGNTWSCPSVDRLHELTSGGSALSRRVQNLASDEAGLITLLATAGVPVPEDFLLSLPAERASGVAATLGSLEQKGLISRQGTGWSVAHDEIAAAAIDAASPQRVTELRRNLAVTLMARHADVGSLKRAFVYANDAGDRGLAMQIFLRLALGERKHGNRRSNRELAHDLLGEAGSPDAVDAMISGLPLSHRMGLYSRARRAAAMAAMVALGGSMGLLAWHVASEPPADVELAVFLPAGDTIQDGFRIPIRRAQWTPGEPIDVRGDGHRDWHLTGQMPNSIGSRPGTDFWYFSRAVPDSGILDVFESDPDGRLQRITFARGDDGLPAFHPDGRSFLTGTARWDTLDRPDIALFSDRGDSLLRFTSGHDIEVSPVWNAAGTDFAFLRRNLENDSAEVCIAPRGGGRSRCGTPEGLTQQSALLGWLDDSHLLVIIEQSGVKGELAVVAMDSWKPELLSVSDVTQASLSPDSRWLACICETKDFPGGSWLVMPADAPDQARPLRFDGVPGAARVAWTAEHTQPWLARLTVAPQTRRALTGVPHRLTAAAYDSRGERVKSPDVRWSLMSGNAQLDSVSGVLLARTPGSMVVVTKTANFVYGVDTLRVEPRESADTLLLRETWNGAISGQWQVIGDPEPVIVIDSLLGMSLLNNGDGRFVSGVISLDTFPTETGLAIDATVSTPINFFQHQDIHLALSSQEAAPTSPEALRIGELKQGGLSCNWSFPGGFETHSRTATSSLDSGGETIHLAAPPWQSLGRSYRIRLQLFPDGRCGVALNGAPLAVTATGYSIPRVRLQIFGATKRTRILVGTIEVRGGVPGDIDWSRTPVPLEGSRSGPLPPGHHGSPPPS